MQNDNDKERDDNPFLSALREERALEREADRISWQTTLLIKERSDALAKDDIARAAELGKEIRMLIDRRQGL